MKILKDLNFLKNFIFSYFKHTAFFVRIIPTDKCNLNCSYCYQKSNHSLSMSWELFNQVFDKAVELKVGFMSFLGGEPMIWQHIYDAIALCSKKNITTDMTTNGTLLNEKTIEKLGKVGLDYLNVSVDTQDNYSVSKKNTLFDDDLVKTLKSAEKTYGMKLRMNGVIYNNNLKDVKLLLELSKQKKIPLSLGFVVPDVKDVDDKEIYFSQQDSDLLKEIVTYILNKKKEKYPVIDPNSYFNNVFKFLEQKSFWQCNYPTRFGWINVTASGAIRSCTKKMDETTFEFISLTPEKIKLLKQTLAETVKECNPYCYSNCAYDSAYYKRNKLAFIKDKLSKF